MEEQNRNAAWREALRKTKNPKERAAIERVKMSELSGDYRSHNSEEVNQGLTAEQAVLEATRCLDCQNPQCVTGCPVGIDIPGFIKNIERGEFLQAAKVLKHASALPAVCGRVCPQEKQCESKCIHLKMKHQAVAIGYLERFAADYERESGCMSLPEVAAPNGIKIAVVGSGPAGLSFAGDMAKFGYDVTVFEALHEIGGVLKYGIPEFRLPNKIVDVEIGNLEKMGVKAFTALDITREQQLNSIKELGEIQYWANELDLTGTAAFYLLNNSVDGIIALSAFGCGPDSLMVDEIQYHANERNMPMIHLTIDEHTGEAGFVTRLEAFVDMLSRKKMKAKLLQKSEKKSVEKLEEHKKEEKVLTKV